MFRISAASVEDVLEASERKREGGIVSLETVEFSSALLSPRDSVTVVPGSALEEELEKVWLAASLEVSDVHSGPLAIKWG